MIKTKTFSVAFIVSLLFFINGGVTLAAPLATPAGVSTSASDYTVLAPLPCVESPDAKYVDSNGVVQTIPGSAIKCEGGNGAVQKEVTFKTYVQYMINLLIALAAVAAVVMIVWGGIEYMTANTPFGKGDGRKRITNAIGGLLLVLCSYLLLRTIDPRLVEIPNTLVPEITLRPDLALDASKMLRDMLESEANAYRIKGAEISALLQQTIKDRTAKQLELDEINAELNKYYTDIPNHNYNDPKYAYPNGKEYDALLVAKSKTEDELRKIDIDSQIQFTKTSLNNRILRAIADALNTENDAQMRIKNLNIEKEWVSKLSSSGNKTLAALGQSDGSTIKEEADYYLTLIDLTKVEVIVADAKEVSFFGLSDPVGGFKPSATRNIAAQNLDGSDPKRETLVSLRNRLQVVINNSQKTQKILRDPQLKQSLQEKINSTTSVMEQRLGK